MVSMTKIYLGIDISFVKGIKEVSYKRKGILIFLCNSVESMKVNI